jgi:hypothetical protein
MGWDFLQNAETGGGRSRLRMLMKGIIVHPFRPVKIIHSGSAFGAFFRVNGVVREREWEIGDVQTVVI